MPTRLYNMFPFPGESLVKSYHQVLAQQSKTNESSRVFIVLMIVRAPATPFARKICDCVLRYDALVYRFGGVVDLGRTTQFLEPHTARGGFESIQRGREERGASQEPNRQPAASPSRLALVLCSPLY